MPWCEPCGRYLTPGSLEADGSCPDCGGPVESGPGRRRVGTEEAHEDGGPDRVSGVPWHFWVVMVLAAVYLLWRLVQGIALLF